MEGIWDFLKDKVKHIFNQPETYFLKIARIPKQKNSRDTGNVIKVNYYKIVGQHTPRKFCNHIEKWMRPHDWNEALFNTEWFIL